MTTSIDRLLDIMARLRDPERGCPWDVEQDFATIAPHTIEEAYEVADAIERGDMTGLVDELGDLLLQVVFHAQMARERGHFDFADVAGAICDKLVRRHPHVFGPDRVADAEAQTAAWEAHKAVERSAKAVTVEADGSALAGVALALPAPMRAQKLQKRAARVGFDWDAAAGVFAKLGEEIAEIEAELAGARRPAAIEDEIGDLLFTAVNLARKLDVDAEVALRRANAKFEARFRRMEAMLEAEGTSLAGSTLAEKEARWQRAKQQEET